jgi:gas vesicle protein
MADGYDRFDNEGGGGGSFVMGLLTGTVLGAGLGMLFAPKAGSELRNQIGEQAGNIANTASDGYRRATEQAGQWADRGRDIAGQWADKGKDAYGQARDAVTRGVDEAQKYVRDTTGGSSGQPSTSSSGTPSPASPGSSSFGSSGSHGSSTGSSGSSYGGGSENVRGSGSTGSTPGGSSTGGSRRS